MRWASSYDINVFYVLRHEYCQQMVGGARGRYHIVPLPVPFVMEEPTCQAIFGHKLQGYLPNYIPALYVMQNILIMQIQSLLFERSQDATLAYQKSLQHTAVPRDDQQLAEDSQAHTWHRHPLPAIAQPREELFILWFGGSLKLA